MLSGKNRALFWVCVIALVGITAYSLGNYYLVQHDKLAQTQHSFVMAARPWQDQPLFAKDAPCEESKNVFEVARRGFAHVLSRMQMMRMCADFRVMRCVVPSCDEMVSFIKPVVAVPGQLAVYPYFRDAQVAPINQQEPGLVLL
jgi:hypothetical protein